jgi:hypothetical protein
MRIMRMPNKRFFCWRREKQNNTKQATIIFEKKKISNFLQLSGTRTSDCRKLKSKKNGK